MQIIGGYPDGNDSNLLRHDPVLQMLVGKTAPGTPEATLASQPTMSRLDNGFTLRQLVRAFDAMVDNFIASYAGKTPAGLVLDLDPTACLVYGQRLTGRWWKGRGWRKWQSHLESHLGEQLAPLKKVLEVIEEQIAQLTESLEESARQRSERCARPSLSPSSI